MDICSKMISVICFCLVFFHIFVCSAMQRLMMGKRIVGNNDPCREKAASWYSFSVIHTWMDDRRGDAWWQGGKVLAEIRHYIDSDQSISVWTSKCVSSPVRPYLSRDDGTVKTLIRNYILQDLLISVVFQTAVKWEAEDNEALKNVTCDVPWSSTVKKATRHACSLRFQTKIVNTLLKADRSLLSDIRLITIDPLYVQESDIIYHFVLFVLFSHRHLMWPRTIHRY